VGRAKEFKDVYLHHFGFVNPQEKLDWKFKWEKGWEHSTITDLFGKCVINAEPPQEILECLKA